MNIVSGPFLTGDSWWVYVALVWSEPNSLILYINDTFVQSTLSGTDPFVGSGMIANYLTLGSCRNGCQNSCLQGSIDASQSSVGAFDEFRVYSRELTPTDVCDLYRSP